MHSLIMFDMDGTLIDSFDGIMDAFNDTFEHYGMEKVTREQCKELIGPKLYRTFHVRYGMSDERSKEMTAYLREAYVKKHMFNSKLYDGMESLLRTLKSNGHRLAIVTNKRYDCAERIAEHLGISQYFDKIYGMNFEDSLEKYQLMERCLSDFDVKGKDALMIGDSEYDKEAADICNVDFVAVSYGFGVWKERSYANVTELLECLVSLKDIIYIGDQSKG